MKKGPYSDEQVVRILRGADKDPVPLGWPKRFASMAIAEVNELKS